VLGKYVAVTFIDSGQLVPTDKETTAGWQSRAKIAYSPVRRKKNARLASGGWMRAVGRTHLFEGFLVSASAYAEKHDLRTNPN